MNYVKKYNICKLPYFLTKKIEKPIGLINVDLNCYMNSVIQCLFHMTKFSDYFINENFSKEEQPISYELKNIFTKLKNRNNGKAFGLNKLKELMGELDDSFLGSDGADASDLLRYIFSSLSSEQTNCIGKDISMMSILNVNEREDVFKDCQDKVGDDTALLYVMNYIQTEYRCKRLHKPFYAFENKCFIEFNLNDLIYKKGYLNLYGFFNYYFAQKKNQQTDEFCTECNKNIKCYSTTNLYKTADYLIIILNYKKNNNNINFKIYYDENLYLKDFVKEFEETKNEKDYCFRLIGVVLHNGDSFSYGHYKSCCLNRNNDKKEEKVYLFNDHNVEEYKFTKIMKYNLYPYILFYEKKFNFN